MSVEWRKDLRPCPLCGSSLYRTLGARGGAAHRVGLGIETSIVRCRSCHGVYPRPFLVPIGNPYESHDAKHYFHDKDLVERRFSGRELARRAESILGRKGRVLEVGSGRGEVLLGVHDKGWAAEGIDATNWGHSDLPIEHATAEASEWLGRRQHYDFIILGAILEHLYDPIAVLRRVRNALVPDGVVYIDVPNECGLWTRIGNAYNKLRGLDWAINLSPTFPPYHVVGFCPKSMRRALVSSGLAPHVLHTTRYRNELPRRRGLSGLIEHHGAEATLTLGNGLGMGAGLACWARPKQ